MKPGIRKLFIIVAILLVLACALYITFSIPDCRDGKTTRPLVLYNANVITVDDTLPRAQAVVAAGGRIAFVGGSAEALKAAPEGAELVDLRGATLIPGFNDDHVHTLAAGSFYSELVLRRKTCSEVAALVKKEAAGKKPGELISGNSWDYPTCPNPHKSLLDKAAPANPVFLVQYSGHAAWVNSKMLQEMKIDKKTPDPKGGQIVRDKDGEPTGILRDTAMGSSTYGKFLKQIFDSETHRRLIDKSLVLYREAGITTVQDNTWEPFTQRLLRKHCAAGTLSCRFTCWQLGDSYFESLFNWMAAFEEGSTWIREGLVKYFADGAFSTRTGWLSEAYADEPGNLGAPRYKPEEIQKIFMEAARARRQISFHAIGDQAVHEVLNAVEMAQAKCPWTKDLRMRMEHVQLVQPGDIERMKRLGVLACVQPFAIYNPVKDVTLLGARRAKRAYPIYSMFRAGVPVAFGSDIPAEEDYRPLLGIYYAVTRMNEEGTAGPLNPGERFKPYDALYCYTMGSAYAEFMEKEKGSITRGKLADMTVLSADLTKVPARRIKDITVLMTVVGGRIVHKR
jgi:hypothetical protein